MHCRGGSLCFVPSVFPVFCVLHLRRPLFLCRAFFTVNCMSTHGLSLLLQCRCQCQCLCVGANFGGAAEAAAGCSCLCFDVFVLVCFGVFVCFCVLVRISEERLLQAAAALKLCCCCCCTAQPLLPLYFQRTAATDAACTFKWFQ